VRNRDRPSAEVLEDDHGPSPADLSLRAVEGPLERLGAEPSPAGLELELEVQDTLGRRQIERPRDLVRVGHGPPIAEDHGERRGPALVRLLRDEGDGGDEMPVAGRDVGANGVERDGRTPACEKARQEKHEAPVPSRRLMRAAHRAYYIIRFEMAPDAPVHRCWVCGAIMREIKCKIVCPHCGYTRDCSDP
jgi:hypothetical protein